VRLGGVSVTLTAQVRGDIATALDLGAKQLVHAAIVDIQPRAAYVQPN